MYVQCEWVVEFEDIFFFFLFLCSAFFQPRFSFTSLVFHLCAGNHRALIGAGGFPMIQTFLPFFADTRHEYEAGDRRQS